MSRVLSYQQALNPLYVLRDYVSSSRLALVKEDGSDIVFGLEDGGEFLRVPSTSETIYKDKSQGEFVTIMSAMLLAKYKVCIDAVCVHAGVGGLINSCWFMFLKEVPFFCYSSFS